MDKIIVSTKLSDYYFIEVWRRESGIGRFFVGFLPYKITNEDEALQFAKALNSTFPEYEHFYILK